MIELPGALAVSDFRIAKLRPALEKLHPGLGGVTARFVHFVDLERNLDADERALLERLLTYGPREPEDLPRARGSELIVVPRFGTISPWSSKATDIARVCGLDAVLRIERGIAWTLVTKDKLPSGWSADVRRDCELGTRKSWGYSDAGRFRRRRYYGSGGLSQ